MSSTVAGHVQLGALVVLLAVVYVSFGPPPRRGFSGAASLTAKVAAGTTGRPWFTQACVMQTSFLMIWSTAMILYFVIVSSH
jgi:hypothetical protein